jgi:AraC family transcriptional regulator
MPSACEVVSRNTFGCVLRGRDFDGLSVQEVSMPPGLRVPSHAHEGAQIYFVLEGGYAETVADARHVFTPGQTWFRPARETHANAVLGSDAALTLIVTVSEHRLLSAVRRHPAAGALHSAVLSDLRTEMIREIETGDDASAAALEGWALLLLSRVERMLLRGDSDVPQWYCCAVEYIRDHFREDISLGDVASHAAVHPATLAVAFRRFRASSVGGFIRELRLQYARDELLSTKRPLKEIALDAGFYDQAHLGRWFTKRFGISPARLRPGFRGDGEARVKP